MFGTKQPRQFSPQQITIQRTKARLCYGRYGRVTVAYREAGRRRPLIISQYTERTNRWWWCDLHRESVGPTAHYGIINCIMRFYMVALLYQLDSCLHGSHIVHLISQYRSTRQTIIHACKQWLLHEVLFVSARLDLLLLMIATRDHWFLATYCIFLWR
jgi:hypothetical protein